MGNLSVSYSSFSPSRADVYWPNFVEDISNIRKESGSNSKVEQNEGRLKLSQEARFTYLNEDDSTEYNPTELLLDLMEADLAYGSVRDDFYNADNFEYEGNEQNEDVFVDALISVYGLTSEKNCSTNQKLPTRQGWISVFENISREKINALAEYVAPELYTRNEIAQEDCVGCVTAFLKTIRPVVKDLKENPDAFFVRIYEGCDPEMLPGDKKILDARAVKHAADFKGSLPPVL